MKDPKAEIEEIKRRNARVEADKAWETSHTRRATITVFTYLCSATVFVVIGASNPYLVALVPALAYALSTVTLPALKGLWLKNRR